MQYGIFTKALKGGNFNDPFIDQKTEAEGAEWLQQVLSIACVCVPVRMCEHTS